MRTFTTKFMKFIHILFIAVLLTACSSDPSKKAKANESVTAARGGFGFRCTRNDI